MAYGIGGNQVTESPTGGRGPNVQYPIGGAVAGTLGNFLPGGGANAFLLQNPLIRKLFGEKTGTLQKNIGPGPLTPLGIPGETWSQGHGMGGTDFSQLQNLVDTRDSINQGRGIPNRSAGYGASFSDPNDVLKRLLQVRGAF